MGGHAGVCVDISQLGPVRALSGMKTYRDSWSLEMQPRASHLIEQDVCRSECTCAGLERLLGRLCPPDHARQHPMNVDQALQLAHQALGLPGLLPLQPGRGR